MISRVVLPEPPPPCGNWNGKQVAASPALQATAVGTSLFVRRQNKNKVICVQSGAGAPGEFIEATDKLATLFAACLPGPYGHPAMAPWPRSLAFASAWMMGRAREGMQLLPPEQIGVEASESSAALRLLTTETKDGTPCIAIASPPQNNTATHSTILVP
nr:unnamed protein product [Digitaria exilis]